MKISKTLKDLPVIAINDLNELQGELKDLTKTNFDKLKNRIEKAGFKIPFFAWNNKGKFYILDGHQRKRVIENTWGNVDVPYVLIEAKNKIEAKKEILAISSQYGTTTKDGFDEFTAEFTDDDFEEVEFETTFDSWMDESFTDKNKEIDIDDLDSDMKITLKYEESEYWKVKEALSNIGGTPEQAVYKLLGL